MEEENLLEIRMKLPVNVNKNINIYKAKNDISSKSEAIVNILEKFFKDNKEYN